MRVSKFGGTSLADPHQVAKAIAIVKSNPARRFVVVSAPGKRTREDTKITDLLYAWHDAVSTFSWSATASLVFERFLNIVKGLGLEFDLYGEFDRIARVMKNGASRDYAASRGEYLMGKIMAQALGFAFMDPTYCIRFEPGGNYHRLLTFDLTHSMLKKHAAHGAVIPGFYGGDLDGREVRVFSRGGSDVTGSIVARSVGAEVYENWTDVSGMYAADPTIVTNPRRIAEMTSAEARELAYMGASVIHPEALFPVGQAGITTRILNTNRPQDPGTDIVPNGCLQRRPGSITGIAGRRGFVVISIDKALMNQEVGFARRALEVLERHGINLDHMPGGIDTVSIVIDGATLDDNALAAVAAEIKTVCAADEVRVERGLAMIATVGQGMVHTPGVAARLTGALAAKRINIRMINQGASELSVIIGVADQDYEAAIRAIYEAHFN